MIRPLFDKYQKEILAFVNTDYGRNWLADSFGQKIEKNERVVKVSPDSFHILKSIDKDKATIQATFYSRSPYLNKFQLALESLEIASEFRKNSWAEDPFVIPHFAGETYKSYLPTVMHIVSPATFNPDAHPETTSVDGDAGRVNDSLETFATLNGGAGTRSEDSDVNIVELGLVRNEGSAPFWRRCVRGFFLFDTSALTAGAIIRSAVFSFVSGSKSTAWVESVALIGVTPASDTALVSADYSQTGSTRYSADLLISDIDAGGSNYNNITVNATGLAQISKTGITKFGMKTASEIDSTEPSSAAFSASFYVTCSDNGSNKPKLVVTYDLPGGSFLLNLL